jgi:copper transport protein
LGEFAKRAVVRLRARTRPLVLQGVVIATALLVASTPAAAHGFLRRASPEPGAVLDAVPRGIHLIFSEEPERQFTRIALIGPDGHPVALGPVTFIPGHAVDAALTAAVIAGTYRVDWQTAGRDGHVLRGSYEFTIAAGASGLSAGSASPPGGPRHGVAAAELMPAGSSGTLAFLGGLLRWFALASVVAAIGAVAFRATVLTRIRLHTPAEYAERVHQRSAVLGAAAAAVFLTATLARLFVQYFDLHGDAAPLEVHILRGMVFESAWGSAWLLQVGVGALALLSFVLARRLWSWLWIAAGAAAVGLALSLALAGHAVTTGDSPAVAVSAHVIHTVAASGWLGGLLCLALVGLPVAARLEREDRWVTAAAVVNAFSPVALFFAALAVGAGSFLAWTHIGTVAALFTTDYGRLLLVKLALLTLTLATGAYNWRRVRPSLRGSMGAARLKRSAGVELAVAAAVLGATAVLVATPPPVP